MTNTIIYIKTKDKLSLLYDFSNNNKDNVSGYVINIWLKKRNKLKRVNFPGEKETCIENQNMKSGLQVVLRKF